MQRSEICVISRNRVWSELLRRSFAGRRHVIRHDSIDTAWDDGDASFCCVVSHPENQRDLEQTAALPRELWQRELMTPVVVVLNPCHLQSWTAGRENGAAGVILSSQPCEVVVEHIERLIRRWQSLHHVAAGVWSFQRDAARLSPRERFIMERLADGWWIKRIAHALGTSPHTVRKQRASLLQKLELESERDMLRLAQGARWLKALGNARGFVDEQQPSAEVELSAFR